MATINRNLYTTLLIKGTLFCLANVIWMGCNGTRGSNYNGHKQVIQEIQSTIPQHFQGEEQEALWHSLAEKFVQENLPFLTQQHKDWNEKFKRLFLQLPSALLQRLIPKLKEAKDQSQLIEAFLRVAPDTRIEAFTESKIGLAEQCWTCFTEWIRKPGTLEGLPMQMQEEVLTEMPEVMPKEDRAEMREAMQEKTKKTIRALRKSKVAVVIGLLPQVNVNKPFLTLKIPKRLRNIVQNTVQTTTLTLKKINLTLNFSQYVTKTYKHIRKAKME